MINRHFGVVEYYHNRWGYVCDYGWEIDDSNVACRQLGYRGASRYYLRQRVAFGDNFFTLVDVDCTGGEVSLLDCDANYQPNCGYDHHVYVECEVGKYAANVTRLF